MLNQTVKIGLVGFGTVGEEVYKILQEESCLIKQRTGATFEVSKVAMRDLSKKRTTSLDSSLTTTDWKEVVTNAEVQVVVELIGGTTIAFEVVAEALKLRKPVVTGNKALLAERGEELFALSTEYDTPIFFEAAVAGGIPVIKTLREAFIGNRIGSIAGIINGTCNYILERMDEAGLSYEDALQEAMDLGYAEADPTLDINGWDAGHKAMLLTAVSHGFLPKAEETYVSGIECVKPEDITLAKQLGYTIKLISIVKPNTESQIEVRTQLSLVPSTQLLAKVDGVFNAVSIHGNEVGESFLYGRGAGGGPTATAVVADLVDSIAALNQVNRGFQLYSNEQYTVAPIDSTETAYFIRLDVKDESGVMAKITGLFSSYGISFSGTYSNIDPKKPDAEMNHVSFITHIAKFGKLQEALTELKALDCVTSTPAVYRVETFS